MIRHQDFLDISLAQDVASFEHGLVKVANHLDFGFVSTLFVTERVGQRPRVVSCGNRPEAYLEVAENPVGFGRDPVLERLKTLNIPFVYDQKLYVKEGAADLWDAQAAFGFRTGIALALHLPGGKHFALGVDRDAALPRSDMKITRMMGDLQLLAVHAQDAAQRLFGTEQAITGERLHLTAREREVLLWTREGKSARDVATILGMSENTVNFHLRNVMTRMGVSSKHMAVRLAQESGLL